MPRGLDVELVGRFKKSEIGNIDQSPLGFDFMGTTTYADTGSKTVFIKESRSGWDKRQCTLQIGVFADGKMRMKPTLIFHGAVARNSARREEEKKYNYSVVVHFNLKA